MSLFFGTSKRRRKRRNPGRGSFQAYLARKRAEYGSKFDPSDLASKFIPFFENGQRIEVDLGYDKKTGTVGVTTGWKPVFLLLRSSRSMGSSIILDDKDRITRVQVRPGVWRSGPGYTGSGLGTVEPIRNPRRKWI